MRFREKVCLVTGAARGIGLAVAQRLAAEGGQVIMADIDLPAAQTAAGGIESPVPPLAMALDVTVQEECDRLVDQVLQRFGSIDVLVNNAGIYAQGDVAHTLPEEWERILRVNVTGPFLLTRSVVPSMIRRGRGVIVNIASEAGLVGIANQIAYNVSKSAMIGFTRSLAVDLARYGIRANAVCPGTTWTPLVEAAVGRSETPEAARRALEESRPARRLGRPEEIAAVVAFAASDEAEYMTGAVLSVDGGYTAQ